MAALSFGIKTAPQHTTYEEMLRVWEEADQIEAIEHAWLFDHFNPIQGDLDGPCLEGWTTLAAYARRVPEFAHRRLGRYQRALGAPCFVRLSALQAPSMQR